MALRSNILPFRRGSALAQLCALLGISDERLEAFKYAGLSGKAAFERLTDDVYEEQANAFYAKLRKRGLGYQHGMAIGPADIQSRKFAARATEIGFSAAQAELSYAGLYGGHAYARLQDDRNAELEAALKQDKAEIKRLKAELAKGEDA